MRTVILDEERREELEVLARRHADGHVRSRALAVRAVVEGHTREEVAAMLPYSAASIGKWVAAFAERGAQAFAIAPGRGRHSRVNDQEVLDCLRVSPERYGLEQSRWTLKALEQACPSLNGMSDQGILNVLHRLGFRYKKGQPWISSPDPDYALKKRHRRSVRRGPCGRAHGDVV